MTSPGPGAHTQVAESGGGRPRGVTSVGLSICIPLIGRLTLQCPRTPFSLRFCSCSASLPPLNG